MGKAEFIGVLRLPFDRFRVAQDDKPKVKANTEILAAPE